MAACKENASRKEWEQLLLAGRQLPADLPKELHDLLRRLDRALGIPMREEPENASK
jgi:hypothetical protein